jgi:hypothetical protein
MRDAQYGQRFNDHSEAGRQTEDLMLRLGPPRPKEK